MKKYVLAFLITIPIVLFVWNIGDSAEEPESAYNGTSEESEIYQAGIVQEADEIVRGEDNVIEADADIIKEDKAGDADLSSQSQEQEKVVDNTQANTERFYKVAEERFGLSFEEAQIWFDIVTEDDIFGGGVREISDLIFDDIDCNGKTDMIIMVQETEMKYLYGTGALYFYMNEEESYCFTDEDFPFFGDMGICYTDLNGDGNVEIAFELQGTGNGGVGDWHKAILSYTGNSIERLAFPADEDSDYSDAGLTVDVIMEPDPDTYTAYCPYFDESITFQASNIYEGDRQKSYLAEAPKGVGSNCRGYIDLQIVMWEGRNALQVNEYLYGEGGIVHCVGWAYFILVWDEQGNGSVADWWVEGELYD